jgi:lysyl-tRNA synthetase class 1
VGSRRQRTEAASEAAEIAAPDPQHWADRIAGEVIATGRPPSISTGISPSGDIHIGNMREVLTGDAVYRALRSRGVDAGFNYVADNFDPLRKVYPFLDERRYAEFVGRPLSEIPCPCQRHDSYGDHFLEPFMEALARLRIDVQLERADRMYKSGRMNPYIVTALERRDEIAAILEELTGRRMPPEWSPFNPLCSRCGRISQARVIGFSAAEESVDYRCDCGAAGTLPMAGGGKLVWRIDWPARWMMLGVTVEPFGKDHSTRGGSYDTGDRIVREIYGGEPPFPIPYEWISLRGGGDMSSSKGNVLSIASILEVVPPEALRYLVMRERPQRRITFDPGIPLLQLVDEVDDAAAKGRNPRALELSMAGGFEPVGVPFKHLVVVAQIAEFDTGRTLEILRRTGYGGLDAAAVERRVRYAERWLARFAGDELRFTVQAALPPAAAELDDVQRRFLADLSDKLTETMDGDAVHALIYDLAGRIDGVRPAHLFQAIYLSLLGKPRGPRAGWFIALVGPAFAAHRFREAAEGAGGAA